MQIIKKFDHNSGAYFISDDEKIYYEVTGNENGSVLLLLHGGFGNIEDFNTLLPDLNQRHKIIAMDSRGHGKSTLNSQILTYELIQRDVEHLLEHLCITKLSIIGFSDGGTVAYRLASMTSLHIEKLVAIGSHWHLKNIESIKEIFLKITGESWRKKFPDTYDTYQKLNPYPDFNFMTQAIIKMWLDSKASGYPNEAIKNISCPLLVIRGDDDHLLLMDDAVESCKLIKNSHFLNVPFAGHVVFEDQKELFRISLDEFLQR